VKHRKRGIGGKFVKGKGKKKKAAAKAKQKGTGGAGALDGQATPFKPTPRHVQEEIGPRPYETRHIKAQRLMGMVVHPDTGQMLTKEMVAEQCGVKRLTLWRWINDADFGGKYQWYREVDRYCREELHEKWALLMHVQMKEALTGRAKVGAFRNIAALLNKKLSIAASATDVEVTTNISIQAQVVVRMPDNGRRKSTSPDGPGRLLRQLEPSKN